MFHFKLFLFNGILVNYRHEYLKTTIKLAFEWCAALKKSTH